MSEFDETHHFDAGAEDVTAAVTGTPVDAALDGASEVGYVDFSLARPAPTPAPVAGADRPDPAAPGPFYPNVAEWVDQWLIPHYKRDPRLHLWDPSWWQYTEAIAVLEALWQAWEFLRQDSMTGMAVFFRDYLWPLMRELTSTGGPFWKLKEITDGALPERWQLDDPPAGMFRTADHPAEQ